MSDRMAMIRRLAETDPYWSAYLDGLLDKRGIRDVRAHDYDTEWSSAPTSKP